jgi:predicted DNA-binding transcriptional regulator AlpA
MVLPAYKTEPRGLRLKDAANHVGVSVNHFLGMVKAGLMPQPRMMGPRRQCWDRLEIESFFARLPHKDGSGYDQDQGNYPEP